MADRGELRTSTESANGAAFAKAAADAISDDGRLPVVTMAMLEDFLAATGCAVLYQPFSARRTFRWVSIVSHADALCAAPTSISDAHLLFICPIDDAAALLQKRPLAFALALADDKKECTPPPAPLSNRLTIIQSTARFSYFALLAQSYFMRLLLWEAELDHIAASRKALVDLLDVGAREIGNFMFVSDANFNIIARTATIDPPDDLHRLIIETGCLSPQMIAEKRFRLPEKAFYEKEPSDITPHARLSNPLYINHAYFGSVSMSCHRTPLTEGLKDLFAIFVRHAMPLFERMWRAQVDLNIPHYFFFSKLLSRDPVSDEYLQEQLATLHLDAQTQYKLIALDIDEAVEPNRTAAVARAASFVNQGDSFCFSHRGSLLVLCYAPPSDNLLSHRRTIADLQERIYRPYGVAGGASCIFENITDIDLAYRQAKIALALRETIRSEQFAADDAQDAGVYLFDDALLYYLVDASEKDERFLHFCFSHTILQKLHEEDLQDGTNHLALFWFYLQSERNATAVAQRLHMHRNTVLYHIEKIQKRFDFDLSQKTARDRMLVDFKAFFLAQTRASAEKIFGREGGF